MQIMVAIGLFMTAILLFVAVKIRLISWINMQIATTVSSVLAFIAAVLFFIIPPQVSNPEIKIPHQFQDSIDRIQESGTASHDTNSNKPIINVKRVKQKDMDIRKFNLFIDVAPDKAGAKVYIDDVLYANAAPCTVKVQEGIHALKLIYNDSYAHSTLVYINSIVISGDDVIRIEGNEFRTERMDQL
jgi:hypothetical protein